MLKLKPLSNRVIIQRSKAKTTKGGIILPDSAQEKPKEGIVVAVGPGKADEQGNIEIMTVKKGDKVLFSAYSGTEVKHPDDAEEYLIVSEDEILAILA